MAGDETGTRDVLSEDNSMLHLAYGLYTLAFLLPVAALVGVVVAYLQRGKSLSSFQDSHVVWQIRTFWLTLIASVIAFAIPFLLGFLGALVALILPAAFFVYRVSSGWYRLLNRQRIVDPGGLF